MHTVIIHGVTNTKEEENHETHTIQGLLLGVKRCWWCTAFWELRVEVHQGSETLPGTCRLFEKIGRCGDALVMETYEVGRGRNFGRHETNELAANECGQHGGLELFRCGTTE